MELTRNIKHIVLGMFLALPVLSHGQEKDHTPGAQGVQLTAGMSGWDLEEPIPLGIFSLGYYRWITDRFFVRGTLYTVQNLAYSEERPTGCLRSAVHESFSWYGGDVAAVYNPLAIGKRVYFNVFAGLSLAGDANYEGDVSDTADAADAEGSGSPLMPGAFGGGEIEVRIAGAFFLIVSGKGNYIISKLNRGWWTSMEVGFKYGF